jgi:hypothetical protein
MAAITMEQSRAIPIESRRAFELTLPIPLVTICSRRYGLLPPVKEIRGQDGAWGEVGQSRTVVTTDGGTMRELLTEVDAYRSFSYRLSEISGPMRPLVSSIDGRWEFAMIGTGTLVTWRWTLYPKGLGAGVLRPIAWMWRGYARQVLELLSDQLLATYSA